MKIIIFCIISASVVQHVYATKKINYATVSIPSGSGVTQKKIQLEWFRTQNKKDEVSTGWNIRWSLESESEQDFILQDVPEIEWDLYRDNLLLRKITTPSFAHVVSEPGLWGSAVYSDFWTNSSGSARATESSVYFFVRLTLDDIVVYSAIGELPEWKFAKAGAQVAAAFLEEVRSKLKQSNEVLPSGLDHIKPIAFNTYEEAYEELSQLLDSSNQEKAHLFYNHNPAEIFQDAAILAMDSSVELRNPRIIRIAFVERKAMVLGDELSTILNSKDTPNASSQGSDAIWNDLDNRFFMKEVMDD